MSSNSVYKEFDINLSLPDCSTTQTRLFIERRDIEFQGCLFNYVSASAFLQKERWQVRLVYSRALDQAAPQIIKDIRRLITDIVEEWWAAEGREKRARMFQEHMRWLKYRIKEEKKVLNRYEASLKEIELEVSTVNGLSRQMSQDNPSALSGLLENASDITTKP